MVIDIFMKQERNNYAFIDSQNVNLAIRSQGWILDWKRFRVHLREKYDVQNAYMFLGYISRHKSLYDSLRSFGYKIVFKPVILFDGEKVKGNVDAELVLHTMIEYNKYERAIIVSNDGDFYCLVEYLRQQNKLSKLLIPDRRKYSSLLRPFVQYMVYMNDLQSKLVYKK